MRNLPALVRGMATIVTTIINSTNVNACLPRNCFTNLLIEPNIGVNMRFFLAKWLTINLGIRDYLFIDKFEPTNRSLTMNATAAQAQANADSAFVNNIMFQIGLSFWLPTSFEYTTFR